MIPVPEVPRSTFERLVRPRGLEPPRVSPLPPQGSASTNSATAAPGSVSGFQVNERITSSGFATACEAWRHRVRFRSGSCRLFAPVATQQVHKKAVDLLDGLRSASTITGLRAP